jgi:hypothetical protein
MRELQEILASKEREASRLEHEIETLRAAIRIMESQGSPAEARPKPPERAAENASARLVGEWP